MKEIIKYLTITLTMLMLLVGCQNFILSGGNGIKDSQSLSKSYKSNFHMGAAINENQILQKDERAVSIIEKEFNSISPENCMKWESLEPTVDSYDFDLADKYVAFGIKNNMHIVGHTLVWHSQLPEFMKEVNDSLMMSSLIQKHIETVVSRYRGKIHTWDVVNEALNNDGTLRESLFLNVLGPTYIEQAFKLTEKFDSDAKLIYNDFNLCKPEKRQGAVRLVKQLQKSGAKIDGIGLQAHWALDEPSLEEIEKSIITYSDLGLKVSFTELDISVLPNPPKLVGAEINQNFNEYGDDKKMNLYPIELPDSVQTTLAKRYEDIFKLFLKHEDKIDRVTFWGVTDKFTWLNDFPIKNRTNYPLLFDRKYQPKKAYHSIMALKDVSKN